jgi:hypothetical protein
LVKKFARQLISDSWLSKTRDKCIYRIVQTIQYLTGCWAIDVEFSFFASCSDLDAALRLLAIGPLLGKLFGTSSPSPPEQGQFGLFGLFANPNGLGA